MARTATRASVLLAIASLALAGCTGAKEPPASSGAEKTTTASDGGGKTYSTDDPTANGEGDCSADSSDQALPAQPPEAQEWPAVNGIGVPVSDTYGPINRDGNVWTCFAHSPKGALFAAIYLLAALPTADVRNEYVTDDPQSDKGDVETSGGALIRGYRFTSYDDTTASLEVAVEASGDNNESSLVAFPIALHWADGRWTVTNNERKASKPRVITGLSGFVAWSMT